MSIKTEIIADSINEFGNRITTFISTMPRIVLSEFNTHRIFSRNSASSRAIPFHKIVKSVRENPFIPIKWQKDHPGMQGTEYFEDEITINTCKQLWLEARDNAIYKAEQFNNNLFNKVSENYPLLDHYETGLDKGLTKQLCNRLLEPFMWHTVIVTATEWENFFALRAHEAAEIHFQKLAYMMLDAYNKSVPKLLKEGEWHIPFGDRVDEDELQNIIHEYMPAPSEENGYQDDWGSYDTTDLKIKIATARCARVSYTVVGEEGKKDNYENDFKLHDRLLQAGHMSPFEHCACAMSKEEYNISPYIGNFKGWVQYRKTLKGENKTDSRIKNSPYNLN